MARRHHPLLPRLVAVLIAAALFAACGDDAESEAGTEEAAAETTAPPAGGSDEEPQTSDTASDEQTHPDVVDATAEQAADGSWTFAVTLSSPYDTPDRYADAWRVVGPDGTEYGVRILTHDHANEQPFTRSQSGIEIPDDVDVVTIEGRDQANGWGGTTLDLTLER